MASLDDRESNGTAATRSHLAKEVEAAEAEIDRARTRVAASMHELGEEVARRGDWRSWVRARPALVLGGALALGFLWGGRGRWSQKRS